MLLDMAHSFICARLVSTLSDAHLAHGHGLGVLLYSRLGLDLEPGPAGVLHDDDSDTEQHHASLCLADAEPSLTGADGRAIAALRAECADGTHRQCCAAAAVFARKPDGAWLRLQGPDRGPQRRWPALEPLSLIDARLTGVKGVGPSCQLVLGLGTVNRRGAGLGAWARQTAAGGETLPQAARALCLRQPPQGGRTRRSPGRAGPAGLPCQRGLLA